ncbi:TIGR02594 family protein [Winogradskyella sp.]|uniref:TIGR02594 family protein n=1 Tax=Winogradskyella sp. TaxID=1883156 RepID=UPI002611A627|nr:TIGR02594 family protein [Winogradskyella sp.]
MHLINKALSEYGVKEIVGSKDNRRILKYFNDLGFDGEKLKDETAWCSAFANWVAKTSGYEYSGKLNARSWLSIGESVVNPEVGDIVVFWRESPLSWKGHVAFFIKATKGYVYVLGGNQGNKVCIKAYPKNRVLDYKKLNKLWKN